MKMHGKVYDVLKFVVWLWVPLATLVTSLCTIWFPGATWVDPLTKTLLAIEVFLGAIVSKSNYDYNQAKINGKLDEESADDRLD